MLRHTHYTDMQNLTGGVVERGVALIRQRKIASLSLSFVLIDAPNLVEVCYVHLDSRLTSPSGLAGRIYMPPICPRANPKALIPLRGIVDTYLHTPKSSVLILDFVVVNFISFTFTLLGRFDKDALAIGMAFRAGDS